MGAVRPFEGPTGLGWCEAAATCSPSDFVYVRLAPVFDNVSTARQRVASFARATGAPPSRVEDVALAVSEAATNAFTPHHDAGSAKSVALSADMEDDQTLHVTVTDYGPGSVAPRHSELLTPAPNSPEDVPDRLGLIVMRQVADEVEFTRAQGMTVSLRLYLPT